MLLQALATKASNPSRPFDIGVHFINILHSPQGNFQYRLHYMSGNFTNDGHFEYESWLHDNSDYLDVVFHQKNKFWLLFTESILGTLAVKASVHEAGVSHVLAMSSGRFVLFFIFYLCYSNRII